MSSFFIEKIELEGFLKYKEKVEKTFQKDLTLITGPNASGKTSLLEAIVFSLFNISRAQSFKDLIHKDKKLAKIALYFNYNGEKYTLKRLIRKTLKGATSTFELYKGNIKTHLKISDMFNFLKVPQKLVKNILYSPQQELVAILSMEKKERESFFKEILSLDIVDNILEILKKQKQRSLDILEFLTRENVSKENLEVLKEEIENLRKEQEKYLKRLKVIKKLIGTFENFKGTLENLKHLPFEKERLDKQVKEIENLISYFKEKYNLQNIDDYTSLENKVKETINLYEKEFFKVEKYLSILTSKLFKIEKVYVALKNIDPNIVKDFETLKKEYLFLKENIYKVYKDYINKINQLKNKLKNLQDISEKTATNYFKSNISLDELDSEYQNKLYEIKNKIHRLNEINLKLKENLNNIQKILKYLENYNENVFKEYEDKKETFEKYKEILAKIKLINAEIEKLKNKFDENLIKEFLETLKKEYEIEFDNLEETLNKIKDFEENPIKTLKLAKKYLKEKKLDLVENLIDKAILTLSFKEKLDKIKINLHSYIFYLEKKKEFEKILKDLKVSSLEDLKNLWEKIKKEYKNLEKKYNENLEIKYKLESFNLYNVLRRYKSYSEIHKILIDLQNIYKNLQNKIKEEKGKLEKIEENLEKLYILTKIKLLKKDFEKRFNYSFENFENYFMNIEKKYKDLEVKYKKYKKSVIEPINQSGVVNYEDIEKKKELYEEKLKNVLNIYTKLRDKFIKRKKELENYIKDKIMLEKFAKELLSLEERKKFIKGQEEQLFNVRDKTLYILEERLLRNLKQYKEIYETYLALKPKIISKNSLECYKATLKLIDLLLEFLSSLYEIREKEFLKIKEELTLKEKKYKEISEKIEIFEKEKRKINIIDTWHSDLINYKTAVKEEFLKNIPHLVSLYYSEIGFNYEVEITPEFNIFIKDGSITRNVRSLSGGEKVGLALALKIALANFLKLPFLILDEPFEALDEDRLSNAKSFLEKYFKNQIIVATHTW